MKIAAYVTEDGRLTTLYERGLVRIYGNGAGPWIASKEIPFEVRPGMTLAEVKSTLRDVVDQLEDCRVLVSAEVKGLIYSLLQEEMGFHIWKSQGPVLEQLDAVAGLEADLLFRQEQAAVDTAAEANCSQGCCGERGGGRRSTCGPATEPRLERIGSGHYRIDLAGVLQSDPNLNSRQVLIPVMKETAFETLEILCDHVPRWFSRALVEMNLRAEFDASAQGLKVLVSPNH
ncbi:Fe-only nitrogenase accessory protein AnfO [Telmatospirillum sp.]|uniref:Fe-only nitrogenase accessory protein AnfO n=1 Tax=Telmatospirillum sp. TaxID=2079197 RepID=UPI00283DE5A7|nr:Fe-only nitrogenase accessory protein AnfO [Telmatospirillum sp.]MDR3435086.1 Fe-only nitrogenase accessory protein AnfO [Telmatospirillum sp.]